MGQVDPTVSTKWGISLLSGKMGLYYIGNPGLWESQGVFVFQSDGRTPACLRHPREGPTPSRQLMRSPGTPCWHLKCQGPHVGITGQL